MEKETGKEIGIVIGASVFLGIILSLTFKYPILNFDEHSVLKNFLLSLLMLGVFVGAQKGMASILDCKTRIKLLGFRRYGLKPWAQFSFDFPLWIVLPLLLFIVGILIRKSLMWLAILDFEVEPLARRVRRRFNALTEEDVGKIALAGPLAVLALGIISKAISLANGIAGFGDFAVLCALLSFLSLIPIGLGFKLLMSSRMAWLFTLIFSLGILLMMHLQSLFAIILIAIIFAIAATLGYYILYEK